MSFHCSCAVALPHGDVGWSAVCDCLFPDHTHINFAQPADGHVFFFLVSLATGILHKI